MIRPLLYDMPASEPEYDYFGAVNGDDTVFLRTVADETVRVFFDR